MSGLIRFITVLVPILVILAISSHVKAEVVDDSTAVTSTGIDSTAPPSKPDFDESRSGMKQPQMFERAETLYRQTIELLQNQMIAVLALAGTLLAILTVLVTIYGYLQPKKTSDQMRQEMVRAQEKIAQLETEMREAIRSESVNSEHFTLALSNVIQGNLKLSLGEKPLAFEYYSTGLGFLRTVRAGYQRLETIYALALSGVLKSSATPWGKNNASDAALVLEVLTFLEKEQYWQQDNAVMSLVRSVRTLSKQE